VRPRLLAIVCIAALVSVLVSASDALAATAPQTMGNYIVVLNDDAGDPATLEAEQTRALGGTVGFIYNRACNGTTFDDQNGHGTHVAGTIGARDDDQGVVGVAPGARLWAVRVLDALGSGSLSQVVCGVDFVTANASVIEVANMSLSGRGSDPGSGCKTGDALHDAICNSVKAGVTYVVAAGNSHEDASGWVPAAYEEVITVSSANIPEAAGATQIRDDLAAQRLTLAELHLDRAYLSSTLVQDRPDDLAVFCRAWRVRNGPRFAKTDFHLDWQHHCASGSSPPAGGPSCASGPRSSTAWPTSATGRAAAPATWARARTCSTYAAAPWCTTCTSSPTHHRPSSRPPEHHR
jgi:hypothetical protein